MEYDVFLSYSHKDKEWVENLASRIESEQHEGRKLRVFRDTRDIQPGSNMVEAMQKGLAQSRYICPVISPSSVNAEWPKMEWSIAVSSDPSGRKGRVIPLWLGECEIPPALNIRFVVFFDRDSDWSESFNKLISALKGSTRSGPAAPAPGARPEPSPIQYEDDVDEQLLSNLFPVSSMPKTVWHGPTTRSNAQVYEHLNRVFPGTLPTFIVKSGRIFCFWDLNERRCPFRTLLSADVIGRDGVDDWLDDEVKSRWLAELLNKGLKHHCRGIGLTFDAKHKRYMFLPSDGRDLQIPWNTGQRKSTRTVVRKYSNGKPFWAHQSLGARFVVLDGDVFLLLDPGWTFTSDGRTPLPKERTGSLSSRWTARERNSSMSYHIRFWSSHLSRSSEQLVLDLGGSACKIHTTPGTADMDKGLEGDIMPISKVFEIGDREITGADELRDVIAETGDVLEAGSVEGDDG